MLIGYGSLVSWLGKLPYESPIRNRACAAWLCPEEFRQPRPFMLLQRSEAGNSRALLPTFQRGVLHDSASAYRWADLAESEFHSGDQALAQTSFRRAIASAPGNPSILFRAANFDFQTGDQSGVLNHLSAILRNPDLSRYYEPAFVTYSRLGVPTQRLLDEGVPPLSTAAEPFLQFWIDSDKRDEVQATWSWMAARSLSAEKPFAAYENFLVRSGQAAKAIAEWKTFFKQEASNYQVYNWLFNPGLESEPKSGPFDWQIESAPHVEAQRVQDVSRDGQWSVRLTFDGDLIAPYRGVSQIVVLPPGSWRLRGYVKSSNLAGSRGIGLRIYDPANPGLLDITSDRTTGTSSWTEIGMTFAVNAQTKMARVEAVCEPKSGSVTGEAWIDSVELTRER